MKKNFFIKYLMHRADGAAIDPRFRVFIPSESSDKVLKFLMQCSIETLNKIIQQANQYYPKACDAIEIWFATKQTNGNVLIHQLPKGIDFTTDIPELCCPTPYWDDEMEIERKYILLTFEDVK